MNRDLGALHIAWRALERPIAFAHKAPSRLHGFAALVQTAIKNAGLNVAAHASVMALVDDFDALSDDSKRDRLHALSALLAPVVSPSPAQTPRAAPTTPLTDARSVVTARVQRARPSAARPTAPIVGDALSLGISSIKGVGNKRGEEWSARGIHTLADALALIPRTYEDRRAVGRISELVAHSCAVVTGTVVATGASGFSRGRRFEVAIDDGTGTLRLVYFYFRQGEMQKRFVRGTTITAVGDVQVFGGRKQMVHPRTALGDATELLGGVHPVYSEMQGMDRAQVARIVKSALVHAQAHGVTDPLPDSVRARAQTPALLDALTQIHAPPDSIEANALRALIDRRAEGHRRLAFEELFVLALAMQRRRAQTQLDAAPVLDATVDHGALFSFALTAAQQRATADVSADLRQGHPMARLLQGDVGSGKTAVAAAACLQAVRAGHQAAVMAPTEILAEQHARTFARLFTPLGIRVEIITGSKAKKARALAEARLRNRDIDIVVGTQALLTEGVTFGRLGLVVVDEQHRFGVVQRAALKDKGPDGKIPHLLVMTATPIPRSLALTLYGDLSVSVLDELPPGRTPIATRVTAAERDVHVALRAVLDRGERAFVVYPLIDASEKLDAQAAVEGYQELSMAFPERTALLHGKLDAKTKAQVMARFVSGDVSILVSTTVVEVGVDVPQATLMVIKDAERFGLAQIHQLRGRVGRSHRPSNCLLVVGNAAGEDARARLEVLEETTDGFRIAEEDLAQRGPGDVLGTRQSGQPTLAFADLVRHAPLIALAQTIAREILADDPQLTHSAHQGLRRLVTERYAERLALALAG